MLAIPPKGVRHDGRSIGAPVAGDAFSPADLHEPGFAFAYPPAARYISRAAILELGAVPDLGFAEFPREQQAVSAAATGLASDGPLTQEHHQQLALANGRAKRIRRAARVAAFNGWVFGIFSALSAPFAPFSLAGFLVTAGLAVIAYNEFRGRKRLLEFDPSSGTLLGWNQVALLTLIVVYCLWMLFRGLTGAGPFAAEMQAHPEIAAAVGSLDEFDHLYRVLVVIVYGTVILLSVIFQGLNALYYFSRRKYVEAYVEETPGWVLQVQRMTTPGSVTPLH